MDIIPKEIGKYRRSRLKGDERLRSSRYTHADRESSSRRPKKNPRTFDSCENDRRHKRAIISEDQFIPLIPSAASDPKENSAESKGFHSSRNPWTENRKTPLENSTQHKENQPIDLSQEFPPLGVSSFSATPEVSKDWGSLVEEEEEREASLQKKEMTNPRSKRKLQLSEFQKENTPKNKTFIVDEHRLQKRQKQIDFGKNTLAYGRYIDAVKREDRTKEDPNTPDKFQACSTRSWVGQIKIWRRKLHVWDPPSEGQEDLFLSPSLSSFQSFHSDVRMEEDSNCDANDADDDMSTSTQCSIDDPFHGFDIDECLMNDGLPL